MQVARKSSSSWQAWAKTNLFSNVFNSVLSVVSVLCIVWIATNVTIWALTQAQWQVIPVNTRILMVGTFPSEQLWRVWATLIIVSIMAGLHWGATSRQIKLFVFDGIPLWPFIFLVIIAVFAAITQVGFPSGILIPASVSALLTGFFVARSTPVISSKVMNWVWINVFLLTLILLSFNFGTGGVETKLWGGLLLTLMLALVGITFSFPLGILLAIGRTSAYPIMSTVCTVFIEIVRGTPLVVVFFIAQLFVPLLLGGINIDPVLRAMVGITIFSAAYLAENVRGGLQSVPIGQIEAARAIGLSGTQTLMVIVLPQALKAVLPALVGQFIGLFKDTSLVSIIGLKELNGVADSARNNPLFIGRELELYFTISVIYFIFSYAISSASRRLEQRLNTSR